MRCEDCVHEKVCEGYSNCEEAGLCEPKRLHGEWKPLGQPDKLGIHSWHICSNCSFQTTWHMVDIFHFCPNCGSDMRAKEGESE